MYPDSPQMISKFHQKDILKCSYIIWGNKQQIMQISQNRTFLWNIHYSCCCCCCGFFRADMFRWHPTFTVRPARLNSADFPRISAFPSFRKTLCRSATGNHHQRSTMSFRLIVSAPGNPGQMKAAAVASDLDFWRSERGEGGGPHVCIRIILFDFTISDGSGHHQKTEFPGRRRTGTMHVARGG